jgi:hypothetical protein
MRAERTTVASKPKSEKYARIAVLHRNRARPRLSDTPSVALSRGQDPQPTFTLWL